MRWSAASCARMRLTTSSQTLVPLALYFKKGWAKCEIGAATGKRAYDKRQAIQKRQQQRDMAREMRRR